MRSAERPRRLVFGSASRARRSMVFTASV
jgi:hypothetical protein